MKGNEVVTLTRPGEPDWQGDRAPGGVYTLRGCQLWPRSSTEDATQGRVILEGWNVYVPAGQPLVEATDTLTIRGEQHQVVGVARGQAQVVGDEQHRGAAAPQLAQ